MQPNQRTACNGRQRKFLPFPKQDAVIAKQRHKESKLFAAKRERSKHQHEDYFSDALFPAYGQGNIGEGDERRQHRQHKMGAARHEADTEYIDDYFIRQLFHTDSFLCLCQLFQCQSNKSICLIRHRQRNIQQIIIQFEIIQRKTNAKLNGICKF